MSDSPRWHLDGLPGTTGIVEVMLYADHAAAVAAARAEEALSRELFHAEGYAQGQRDERERIVAALEAVYRYGGDRDPSAFELEVYEFIQTAIKGDN